MRESRERAAQLKQKATQVGRWLLHNHKHFDDEVEFLWGSGDCEVIGQDRPTEFAVHGIRLKGTALKGLDNRAGGAGVTRSHGTAIKLKENDRPNCPVVWGECVDFIFKAPHIAVQWVPMADGGFRPSLDTNALRVACQQATGGVVRIRPITTVWPPPEATDIQEWPITSIQVRVVTDLPKDAAIRMHCTQELKKQTERDPSAIVLNPLDGIDASDLAKYVPLVADAHGKQQPAVMPFERAWRVRSDDKGGYISLSVLNGKGEKMKGAGKMKLSHRIPGVPGTAPMEGTHADGAPPFNSSDHYWFQLPALRTGVHKFEAQLASGHGRVCKLAFEVRVAAAAKAERFQAVFDDDESEIDWALGPLPPIYLKATDIAGAPFELPPQTYATGAPLHVRLSGSQTLTLAGQPTFDYGNPGEGGVRAVRCTGLELRGKLAQRQGAVELAFSWGDYATATAVPAGFRVVDAPPWGRCKLKPMAGAPTELHILGADGELSLGVVSPGRVLPQLQLRAQDADANVCTEGVVDVLLERNGDAVERNDFLLFDNSFDFPEEGLMLVRPQLKLNEGRFKIDARAHAQPTTSLLFVIRDVAGVRTAPITFSVEAYDDDDDGGNENEIEEVDAARLEIVLSGAGAGPQMVRAGEPFTLEVCAFSAHGDMVLVPLDELDLSLGIVSEAGPSAGGAQISLEDPPHDDDDDDGAFHGWRPSPGEHSLSVQRRLVVGCHIPDGSTTRAVSVFFTSVGEHLAKAPAQLLVSPGAPAAIRFADAVTAVNAAELSLSTALEDAYGSLTTWKIAAGAKWTASAGEGIVVDGFKQQRGATAQLCGRALTTTPVIAATGAGAATPAAASPIGRSLLLRFGGFEKRVALSMQPGTLVPRRLRVTTADGERIAGPLRLTAQAEATLPALVVRVELEDGALLDASHLCHVEYWIDPEQKIKSKADSDAHARRLDGLRVPITPDGCVQAGTYDVTLELKVSFHWPPLSIL